MLVLLNLKKNILKTIIILILITKNIFKNI